MATISPRAKAKSSPSYNPAVDVLMQWLTYVMWILGVLAIASVAVIAVTYFFIEKSDDYSYMTYLIAAVIILIPVADIVDYWYSMREHAEKRGFSAVVMVIHAVIVALVGVAALITVLLYVLQLWVIGAPTPTREIVLASALTLLALNALLFMRIVDVPRLQLVRSKFSWIMATLAVAALVIAVAGPVLHTVNSKSDRIIDDGLPTIDTAVQDYVATNSVLPASLAVLSTNSSSSGDLDADGTSLIKNHLVTYAKEAPTPAVAGSISGPTLNYELCATYKYAGSPIGTDTGETALTNGEHGAGYVCYQLNSSGAAIQQTAPTIKN